MTPAELDDLARSVSASAIAQNNWAPLSNLSSMALQILKETHALNYEWDRIADYFQPNVNPPLDVDPATRAAKSIRFWIENSETNPTVPRNAVASALRGLAYIMRTSNHMGYLDSLKTLKRDLSAAYGLER